ncbi:MAG: hypothetical protein M3331_05645, partial [Actinomycetota bacterium]|nr:hypothetical protein [Actinomycetota bacterium]
VAVLAITDTAIFEDPPTEEERVADAVTGFFAAAADEDFERDCELLTKEAQGEVRISAARVIEDSDERIKCPEILELVFRDSFAEVVVRVRSVSISGNRARVEAALKPKGESSQFRTILLELSEEGDWLLSDFG